MVCLMACYADVVSIGFGQGLDGLRTNLDLLREQCEALHRPCEQIEKTTFFTPPVIRNGHLDPAALDAIAALADLGFDEILVRQAPDAAGFKLLASELIPAVTRLSVAGR